MKKIFTFIKDHYEGIFTFIKDHFDGIFTFIIVVCFGCLLAVSIISSSFRNAEPIPSPSPDISEDYDSFYFFVDPETGVNYVVFDDYGQGGICVRYNSDGTIFVSPIK